MKGEYCSGTSTFEDLVGLQCDHIRGEKLLSSSFGREFHSGEDLLYVVCRMILDYFLKLYVQVDIYPAGYYFIRAASHYRLLHIWAFLWSCRIL